MLILNKSKDIIPEGARYVGRPGPLGNPFLVGKDGTREEVIEKYRQWFRVRLEKEEAFLVTVEHLRGTPALVCWCAPNRCHAEVIAEYLRTGKV